MKFIIIFCLVLPSIYFSQNIRFVYGYRFVSDTIKKNEVTNEVTVLDFNSKEKKSVFTSLKHIISDSTLTANFAKGISSFPDISTKINYVIEKNERENYVIFYTPDNMTDPVLKVKDDRSLDWNISSEHQFILGYKVQKATTYFVGRKWTAWFTEDIPISDGPYKFRGLPGLILKISDKSNTHSFEILSVQKQTSNFVILNDSSYKVAKYTSLLDYDKMVKEDRKNPLQRVRNKVFNGDMVFHSTEEKQNFLKNVDANIEEIKIHDNNPIEKL